MPSKKPKSASTRKLNPKQQMFATYVALQGMDIYAAYNLSFYGKHVTMSKIDPKIYSKAHKLWSDERVQSYYRDQIHSMVSQDALSPQQHMNYLSMIRDMAMGTGELGVALRAEVARGEVVGLYVTRTENVKDPIDVATGMAKLADLIMRKPEIIANLPPSAIKELRSRGLIDQTKSPEILDQTAKPIEAKNIDNI